MAEEFLSIESHLPGNSIYNIDGIFFVALLAKSFSGWSTTKVNFSSPFIFNNLRVPINSHYLNNMP
jgi:hypothetical protein